MAGVTKTKSHNHLRAWRIHRRLTQAQLGEMVSTTANVISQLESGVRGLSDKWLFKLAPALGTTPGFLLDHDPKDLDTEWASTIESVDPSDRPQVIAVLKALRTGRTNNK